MKTRTMLWRALALAAAFGLTSCNKAPHLQPGYVVPEEVAANYMDALRWKNYDEAEQFIAREARPAFEKFAKQNENRLNIIDYKITGGDLKDNGYTAAIKIKRDFFLVPSMSEQSEEMVQTWKLVNGKWCLSGPPF